MPQIKAEKKLFLNRVDKNTQIFSISNVEPFAVRGFQELQKNIARGAE